MLICPDHFGGALSATQATAALARSWVEDGHVVITAPMSDGGTGLTDAIHSANGGTLTPLRVTGALGDPVPSALLHVPGPRGGSSFCDAAPALGSRDTPSDEADRDAMARRGTSAGVGDMIAAGLDSGATRIVVGAGQSPTHDGGAGMLFSLAAHCGVSASDARTVIRGLRAALAGVDLIVAAAQDTPLLGLHGAAAGLQRLGVDAAVAQQIERRTADFAHTARADHRSGSADRTVLAGSLDPPGPRANATGVGGGVGYALGLLGARLLPGAQVVAQEIGLRSALRDVDLVITGTQRLDSEAIYGGVVATVGELAAEHGLAVVALAHEVYANRRELAGVGISAAYPIIDARAQPGATATDPPRDPALALALRGRRVMRNWASS